VLAFLLLNDFKQFSVGLPAFEAHPGPEIEQANAPTLNPNYPEFGRSLESELG